MGTNRQMPNLRIRNCRWRYIALALIAGLKRYGVRDSKRAIIRIMQSHLSIIVLFLLTSAQSRHPNLPQNLAVRKIAFELVPS